MEWDLLLPASYACLLFITYYLLAMSAYCSFSCGSVCTSTYVYLRLLYFPLLPYYAYVRPLRLITRLPTPTSTTYLRSSTVRLKLPIMFTYVPLLPTFTHSHYYLRPLQRLPTLRTTTSTLRINYYIYTTATVT